MQHGLIFAAIGLALSLESRPPVGCDQAAASRRDMSLTPMASPTTSSE